MRQCHLQRWLLEIGQHCIVFYCKLTHLQYSRLFLSRLHSHLKLDDNNCAWPNEECGLEYFNRVYILLSIQHFRLFCVVDCTFCFWFVSILVSYLCAIVFAKFFFYEILYSLEKFDLQFQQM